MITKCIFETTSKCYGPTISEIKKAIINAIEYLQESNPKVEHFMIMFPPELFFYFSKDYTDSYINKIFHKIGNIRMSMMPKPSLGFKNEFHVYIRSLSEYIFVKIIFKTQSVKSVVGKR